MNLSEALHAFEAAYQPSPREGLSVTPGLQGGALHVEVRHQDTDELRGFDVTAQPTPAEARTAAELGEAVARAVEQELAYGQLPARNEQGHFKHITV